MSHEQPTDDLLAALSADAPMERMRSRVARLTAEPPRRPHHPLRWLAWVAVPATAAAVLIAVWPRPPVPGSSEAGVRAALDMLAAPATFERLRGVNAAADLKEVPPEVRAALLERLERDPSVNIRLAALAVLLERELPAPESQRLADVLVAQETAIVQAHLALELRRRRVLSAAELGRLLEHRAVRAEARDALNRLEES